MIDHVGLGVSDLERSGVSQIGRPASFHPGDNPGYQSFSASIPDADTSIVVLLNDDAVQQEQVVDIVGTDRRFVWPRMA